MKRGEFLRSTFLLTGGVLIAQKSFGAVQLTSTKGEKLVILHTNDTHSNIEPFPANHNKFPNRGGVARRFKMIQEVREQNNQVLLLDAGDIFQGTPYFNKYKGHLEMRLMAEMGYDVATLGNHDFDIGIDGFISAYSKANFPFVNCNYDFGTTAMSEVIKPYHIIQKGKIKIGILGVGVELDGLVPKPCYDGVTYHNPIDAANKTARLLKEKGCDLILCLSHLGYDYEDKNRVSDLILARQSEDIHLIIGGHTHTFLEEPTSVSNIKGNTVLVNQVGYAGLNLGRIEIQFERGSKSASAQSLKI